MELIYLSDVGQLDIIKESKDLKNKKIIPITGDMTIAYELEKMKIDFIDEWNYITEYELTSNWNRAHILSVKWYNENLGDTEYEEFQLADATHQDMVWFFQGCLNAITIYKKIVTEIKITKISGYFLHSTAVIRTGPTPARIAVSSITQAILIYIANNNNITVNKIAKIIPLSKNNFKKESKEKIFEKIQNYILEINKKVINKKVINKEAEKKYIIIFKETLTESEYENIVSVIKKEKNREIITIYTSLFENKEKSKVNKEIKNKLNYLSFKIEERCENYDGEYPEIYSNKELLFQFKAIVKEMQISVDHGNIFKGMINIFNPSLIIFGHEAFTRERIFEKLAKNKKIPTISITHGAIRHAIGYRGSVGEADMILVPNRIDSDLLIKYNINSSRINIIGSLGYENKYKNYIEKKQDDFNTNKRKNSENKVEKIKILLITAPINSGMAAPMAEPKKHREALFEILELIRISPNLELIIKPHPNDDYYEMYRRMGNTNKLNIKIIENKSLEEIVRYSNICLMVNYCTTAVLEAIFQKIPVIYLNNAVYKIEDYKDNLLENGIIRIKSVKELEKYIKLLENREYYNKIIINSKKQIEVTLGIKEGFASNRLENIIEKILVENKIDNDDCKIKNNYLENSKFGDKDYQLNKNNNLIKEIDKETLIYCLSYKAGMDNKELYYLKEIYSIIREEIDNKKFDLWKKVRWKLIPIYISGFVENCNNIKNNLILIQIIILYLINPGQYMKLKYQQKNKIKKMFFIYMYALIFK